MKKKRLVAIGATVAVTVTAFASVPPAAAAEEVLTVDFSQTTGEFRGGASGTLYGFGDDGAPTQALINGAHITNTSQKAPYGTQHPSGDALSVEDGFFAQNGEDMYIYMQDYYPDWSYNGGVRPGDDRTYDLASGTYSQTPNGVWDYLEVVEFVADAVARGSSHPEKYVLIPFNEPDGGNWYPNWATQKAQFLADWQSTYEKIQEVWERHGLGHARIGGPGDTRWQPERSADILAFAQQHGSLPDVFIWHELGIDNLATYRSHYADYRALEQSLGIDPLHINITEYGMLRDMGVPGQLVQWFSMFEDTKVDAQTAYWNYAGNLSDNTARPNGANAGWWMFKWYGDLEGSQTVKVAPPSPDTVDTLQGIGALDTANRRATVLWGGTDSDVTLDLRGLSADVFGDRVDVEVREVALTGAEGLASTPRVVKAMNDVPLSAGSTTIAVPTYDRYAGYQLIITPAQTRDVSADAAAQAWTTSVEAEDLALTDAQVYIQDPLAGGGWKFLASGGKDVGSFNRATSKADWSITVPHDGTYRLQVIGATPGAPGRHALFVDGQAAGTVQYAADLALNATSRWQYRGSAEILVPLTAGDHVLSLRASADGTTRLPNSDITLDKLSLTDVTAGEPVAYPASGFRLGGGAVLDWNGRAKGAAWLQGAATATFYASAMDSGYYDVDIDWNSTAPSTVSLEVNGRAVTEFAAADAGTWSSTARVRLSEGISEVVLRSPEGASVGAVTTIRARESDAAAVSIDAENATLLGAASVRSLDEGTGTNASGGAVVGGVGQGRANAISIARQTGFDVAGDYELEVHYANAELVGDHAYNPQVVDRRLDVDEGDTHVGDAHFRYTYSWNSVSQRTIPVTLSTADAPLRLYNSTAWAPDIDRVVIAPLVVGTPTTMAAAADVTATVTTRCVAGKVVLVASVTNHESDSADVQVRAPYGTKTVSVAAGSSKSTTFSTRLGATEAGAVELTGSAAGLGFAQSVTFDARTCG